MADTPPPAPRDETPERYLTTAEAAVHVRRAQQTLRAWRIRGGGPKFVKLGDGPGARCAYAYSELLAWILAHTFASTSEVTAASQARR